MAPLTVPEQDERIRRLFPSFKLVLDLGWWAVWEGTLTPICQTYKVRIRLIRRRYFDSFYLANSGDESITILDPPIGHDPRGTGEPPQHVYGLGHPPDFPRLCVHDPAQEEWDPEKSIADILIPMIIKWLIFHEDWVDTGVWRGGGRHPEPAMTEEPCQNQNLNLEDRDRQERYRNDAFHRFGQRVGVFGSYLWMAEGFEAHFPRPYWPNLNVVTGKVMELETTSILSPARQPAVFSPLESARAFQPANSANSMSTAEVRSSRSANDRSLAA